MLVERFDGVAESRFLAALGMKVFGFFRLADSKQTHKTRV